MTEEELKADWKDPMFFIDGQLCQHLRCMFEDSREDLWFGTNVYGLMHYNGDSLRYYDEKDGLGAGRINGFVEDSKARVWIATYSGLSVFDGDSFSTLTEYDGLINNYVTAIMLSSKGELWVGTVEGISIYDGKGFRNFEVPQVAVDDTSSRLGYRTITSIMEDRYGDIWIGTDGFGLWKYDNSTEQNPKNNNDHSGFRHFSIKNGLPDNNIMGLKEDSKGNIWIGTMFGGLSIIRSESPLRNNPNPEFWNPTKEGLIEGIEVYGYFEDEMGNIWFSAENHGVYRYDGNSFTNYYKNHGLQTNGILTILKDKKNRFWFGGWGGLFRYDNDSFIPVTLSGPWD